MITRGRSSYVVVSMADRSSQALQRNPGASRVRSGTIGHATVGVATHCFVFFFSSRRRHTRFDCDWSSDVCSSDLADRRRCGRGGLVGGGDRGGRQSHRPRGEHRRQRARDAPWPRAADLDGDARLGGRKSGGEGKRGDLGGRRIIKKKKKRKKSSMQ